jgi:E3 ubiquitin-protein ligase HUWE1
LTNAPDDTLVDVLATFQVWRYPKGDLHGWIAILDRFDDLLEKAITEYGVAQIQANDFTPKTKQLILEMLRVEKILLENCTNRKLFLSYDVSCHCEAVWGRLTR